MFASLQAILTESGLLIFAALALAAAIAAFLYLPVVGRPLAAVLLAIAAALGAYDLGYAARGRLDESGALAAQLAEEKRQAAAAQTIAQAASAREAQANQAAVQLNERISDYERQLAARAAAPAPVLPANCPALDRSTCGCLLGPDDVRGLRNIGPAGAPAAAGAPRVLRSPRLGP